MPVLGRRVVGRMVLGRHKPHTNFIREDAPVPGPLHFMPLTSFPCPT